MPTAPHRTPPHARWIGDAPNARRVRDRPATAMAHKIVSRYDSRISRSVSRLGAVGHSRLGLSRLPGAPRSRDRAAVGVARARRARVADSDTP